MNLQDTLTKISELETAAAELMSERAKIISEVTQLKTRIYEIFADDAIGKYFGWTYKENKGFYYVCGKDKENPSEYVMLEFFVHDNEHVGGMEKHVCDAHSIYSCLSDSVSEITKEEFCAGVKQYLETVKTQLTEWVGENA